jgi:hypothetical protein
MTRVKWLTGLLVVPLVAAGIALSAGPVIAQDGEGTSEATLEIHKAECFHGVGPDIFESCHDNVLEGIGFTVNGAGGTTDADGRINFHGPATTVTITEDPAVLAQYLGAYVYCRDLTDDVVLFDGSATDTGGVVTIDVQDGDQVVCDWYDITEGTDTGDTGDAGDTGGSTGSTGATTLPQTGVGANAAGSDGTTGLLLGILGVLAAGGAAMLARRRPVAR